MRRVGKGALAPCPPFLAPFVVRATVTDPAKREAFGTWYSREHLPDAMKSFGAVKAWRYWSATDPSLHHAMYQFTDKDRAGARDRGTGDEASGRRLQPRLAGRDADARGAGAGGGTRG